MSRSEYSLTHIQDQEVDDALDAELCQLLTTCFPHNELFQKRRYNREMPHHRWLARGPAGDLAGHLAIHDKTLGTEAGDLRIVGVAEVCVHPDHRARGLARQLVATMHQWASAEGFPFAMLFGNARVYGGSGYYCIDNPLRYWHTDHEQWMVEPIQNVMVRPLTEHGQSPPSFPTGEVDLRGPRF